MKTVENLIAEIANVWKNNSNCLKESILADQKKSKEEIEKKYLSAGIDYRLYNLILRSIRSKGGDWMINPSHLSEAVKNLKQKFSA
jgi:hypothetical protein